MADQRFNGLWKLVSLERQGPDGQVEHPFGEDPVGIISYYPSGHMSVHIMRRGRPPFASGSGLGTPEEIVSAFRGFTAYFGTYEVDERGGAVIHHVQGASTPNNVGGSLKRLFSFSGNRLTLRVVTPLPAGGQTTTRVVWERLFS